MKNNHKIAQTFGKKLNDNSDNISFTEDQRMRTLANYIIDKFLDDYKRGLLNIPPKQAILIDKIIAIRSVNIQ